MSTLICPGRWERLLLCTDGSPASQGAVNAALALGRACGSQVQALHVVEINPIFEAQLADRLGLLEEEIVAPLKAQAAQLGVALTTRVCRSEVPPAAIAEVAEKFKPDLIFMGRHGRSGLTRLMLGSVTARVIGLTPFKVLVVPRGATLSFQRLLVASDGSPDSEAAWEEALAIARGAGSQLLAVAVAREEGEFPQVLARLDGLRAAANRQGVPVETRVLQGVPDDAIVQAALHSQADLILMGCRGRTGLSRLLLGSVAERVIGQTPCPVMIVKRR
jgi:nucleotide-binding universal stress UspA family protein